MIFFTEPNILKLQKIRLILILSVLTLFMDKIKAPVLSMNKSHVDDRKSCNVIKNKFSTFITPLKDI